MKQRVYFCTSADGTKIGYTISGEGPPLVMSSTFLSHLEYEQRGLPWKPWLDALSREYTLIRYDPAAAVCPTVTCGTSHSTAGSPTWRP